MAEGARLEIVCTPPKVYRGFESRSLRQINNVETLQATSLHYYKLESLAQAIAKFGLIPVDLSIKSLCRYLLKNMAGSRATKACEPRQVRKEAAAAIPSCAAVNPVIQLYLSPT